MVKFLLKHHYLIFFLFVLIFRLTYASAIVNFSQDQARDVVLMGQLKEAGTVLVGYGPKASVGNFYLAPFYYQLHYFLSLFTNNHPLTMHYFTVLVESLTPLLLILILKKFVSLRTAFVAALLFAISPLVTIFSTFAWNPNMIPFLSTLSLWLFLEFWEKNRWWQVVGGVLAVALAIHLHYQAIVLLPFVVAMLVLTIRKPGGWKNWLGALTVASATMLPYFIAELSNNWINTREILSFFTGEHSRYFDRVSKPEFVLTFIPRFVERVLIKENFGWLKVGLGRLVFLGGFLLLTVKAIKKPSLRLVWLYFVLILLMLRVYKGDKLDYYLSTLYILPYFLLALLFELKKALVALAIGVAWLAGGQYALFQHSNQLAELEQAVAFLNQASPEPKVKLIFHDDNYVNIFSYGLRRFSNLQPDSQAKLVVDVCYAGQNCDWDGLSWCDHDRGYTYAALFREAGHYQALSRYLSDGYSLSLGQVDQLPVINYQIFEYSDEYGSDIIDSEWLD